MDPIWLEISATTISGKNIKINTTLLIKNTCVIFRRNIINLDDDQEQNFENKETEINIPRNYLLNYKYTHEK